MEIRVETKINNSILLIILLGIITISINFLRIVMK